MCFDHNVSVAAITWMRYLQWNPAILPTHNSLSFFILKIYEYLWCFPHSCSMFKRCFLQNPPWCWYHMSKLASIWLVVIFWLWLREVAHHWHLLFCRLLIFWSIRGFQGRDRNKRTRIYDKEFKYIQYIFL